MTPASGQKLAPLTPNRRFAQLLDQLDAAKESAQKGLQDEDSKAAGECYLHIVKEYEMALGNSLKIRMNAHQCAAFDERCHAIECLRRQLEKRLVSARNPVVLEKARSTLAILNSASQHVFESEE